VATAHKHTHGPRSNAQVHGHEHGYGHDNLIREAEAEMNELSWGELMIAGGLAGMVSWTVSSRPAIINLAHPGVNGPAADNSRICYLWLAGNLPSGRPENSYSIRPTRFIW
jgi:hypothetical protein